MTFSLEFFRFLTLAALILCALGALTLIVLLVRDFVAKNLW